MGRIPRCAGGPETRTTGPGRASLPMSDSRWKAAIPSLVTRHSGAGEMLAGARSLAGGCQPEWGLVT
jgi:hypothetical protein